MSTPYQQIIALLNEHTVPFELIEHEPVFTSEQAAQVRGLSMDQGAKSLLLKTDESFLLVVLPGSKKVDSKKVKKLGIKHHRFASPQEVKETMNCEVGSCYPFGSVCEIPMVVDQSMAKNVMISFNPGVHDKSIKMRWSDYKKITELRLVDVSSQ